MDYRIHAAAIHADNYVFCTVRMAGAFAPTSPEMSRYGDALTMDEIGQIYGISKMAVSKRLKKLHEKLGSSVS